MSQQDDIVYLVHFRRPDGKSLFLSPFNRLVGLTGDDRKIQGLFGSEPEVESISHVRELLYAKVDIEVRRRLSERRFIPKFLLSALVFLVMYFFLSFAIRDPLPIVDEAVGAAIAAVLCFTFIGRRDELSVRAVDERAQGRARVDAIAFEQSESLVRIEDIIQNAFATGKTDVRTLYDQIRNEKEKLPPALQKQIRDMIEEKIKPRVLKRLPKRFGEIEPEGGLSFNDMKRWSEVYRIDPSIVMLYLSFNLIPVKNR